MERNKAPANEGWIDRAHRFAVQVLLLVNRLPTTTAGRAMGAQLARSGPSVVHNLEEAKAAATASDTYHKTVTARKEASESRRSLMLVRDAGLLPAEAVGAHIDEATAFVAMLTAGSKRLEARIPPEKRRKFLR